MKGTIDRISEEQKETLLRTRKKHERNDTENKYKKKKGTLV
jgi:hypothetical protein